MICIGFGFGVTNETWFPSQEDTGAKYKLPKGLAPLAKHKKDLASFKAVKTSSAETLTVGVLLANGSQSLCRSRTELCQYDFS